VQAEVAAELQAKLRMAPGDAAAWGRSLVMHHTWMVLARWVEGGFGGGFRVWGFE
jgi:hypothetical protein